MNGLAWTPKIETVIFTLNPHRRSYANKNPAPHAMVNTYKKQGGLINEVPSNKNPVHRPREQSTEMAFP